jgi:hypothetical protein
MVTSCANAAVDSASDAPIARPKSLIDFIGILAGGSPWGFAGGPPAWDFAGRPPDFRTYGGILG